LTDGWEWADAGTGIRSGMAEEVRIEAAGAILAADQVIPADARGVVLFAHGSGSSRRSSRNVQVAEVLQAAGFGTVLADLLTAEEEMQDARTAELRFNIVLLAGRVVGLVDWVRRRHPLPLGLFGASTGAAAALIAAARRQADVGAVVSRGGRPDLAGATLTEVKAPTLLVVGGADETTLGLNQRAMAALPTGAELHIVPGATHLFPEPGALEDVARQAASWFDKHL
jgi:pimeloyl-ACP methyl ester carboxylesterase